MLYAPRSGGVKRYLSAKRAWFAVERPHIRHSLVVPGAADSYDGRGLWSIYTAPLPFGDGYRWPASKTAWMKRLIRQRPSLIEAGDPYTPGLAALRAGQRLGVPVIGFCHTDLAALAALHFGEWAEKPVRRRWARIYSQFDQVIAPSRYIAERLAEAGVDGAIALPLGVDVSAFNPGRADRMRLRQRLGLSPDRRLLVFAGRPAREKKIDVLIDAVERLGDPYHLLLIGAGPAPTGSDRVISLPYERDAAGLARLLASCDAFVHANDAEPFGLVVLEAMACGLPVVGPGVRRPGRNGRRGRGPAGRPLDRRGLRRGDRGLVRPRSRRRRRPRSRPRRGPPRLARGVRAALRHLCPRHRRPGFRPARRGRRAALRRPLTEKARPMDVGGTTEPGFAAVRDAFAQAQAKDAGGAQLCVYHQGRQVVDLWTGRDVANDRPYTGETLSLMMSATKGVVATAANMLSERGLLDFDAPAARYWPQFAAQGKAAMPVSYLMSHRAGLTSYPADSGIVLVELLDWSRCVTALAGMAPRWAPALGLRLSRGDLWHPGRRGDPADHRQVGGPVRGRRDFRSPGPGSMDRPAAERRTPRGCPVHRDADPLRRGAELAVQFP